VTESILGEKITDKIPTEFRKFSFCKAYKDQEFVISWQWNSRNCKGLLLSLYRKYKQKCRKFFRPYTRTNPLIGVASLHKKINLNFNQKKNSQILIGS